MDVRDYNSSLARNRERYNDSVDDIRDEYEETINEQNKKFKLKTDKRRDHFYDTVADIEEDYEVKLDSVNKDTNEIIKKNNRDTDEKIELLERRNKTDLEKVKRLSEKEVQRLGDNYKKDIEDYKKTAEIKAEVMAKKYDEGLDLAERDARKSYDVLKDNVDSRWDGEKEKNISPLKKKIRTQQSELTDNIVKNERRVADLEKNFADNINDRDKIIRDKNQLLKSRAESFSNTLQDQAIANSEEREALDKSYTNVISDIMKNSNKGPGKVGAEMTQKLKSQADEFGVERSDLLDFKQRQINEINKSAESTLASTKGINKLRLENQGQYYNNLLDKLEDDNSEAVAEMQKRFSSERVELITNSKDELDFVSNRILDEYANKFNKLSLDYQRSLSQIEEAHVEERDKLVDKIDVLRDRFDRQLITEKESNERKLTVERKGMKDHIDNQAREHEKQLHKLQSEYEDKMVKIRKDNIDKLNNLRNRYDEELLNTREDYKKELTDQKLTSADKYNRLEQHRKDEVDSLIRFYEQKLDEARNS